MTPAEAWDLTPREMAAYSRGVAERDAANQRLLLAASWHAAALQRQRKMPKLRDLIRKITGPRRRERALTPAQQANQLQALAVALGGAALERLPKLKRRPPAPPTD